MVANRGKSLRQQLDELFVKVGSFYPMRENFRLTDEVKEKFTSKLKTEPREFFGQRVSQVVRTDGLKLVLEDGSWVCYRLSGTEPVVRVYSEARSPGGLKQLSARAKEWIFAG
jgi:phosphoglucomutase